jgi:hypothetical protein
MTRRVFFSFHHARDVWRVGQVRNCGLGRGQEAVGFWDAAEWEKLKRTGEAVVRRWINTNLEYTSVTAVLIGAETALRPWVRYEIIKSFERGNGLLGIAVHNVKDVEGKTDFQGENPFDNVLFRLRNNDREVDVWEWNGSQWTTYYPLPVISSAALRTVGYAREGRLSQFIAYYDWVQQLGRDNIGAWVENAARQAGR